jgi:hypothetical protein
MTPILCALVGNMSFLRGLLDSKNRLAKTGRMSSSSPAATRRVFEDDEMTRYSCATAEFGEENLTL